MPDSASTIPASGQLSVNADALSSSRFVMIIGVTAVLFFLGLLPLEAIPEIPVDIDSKPFFIPLVLVALLPAGRPGVAIGLGVALGEFLRDLMEGYELDDPIGFVGYFVAFALTSLMFGKQPPGKLLILIAALFCAFVQAAIEASSFLLFGEESLGIVIQSTLGNTFMHGVIWGAIPAFFLVPILQGRFEHYLGFATKGRTLVREPLVPMRSDFAPAPGAVTWIKGLQFRYPSSAAPVLGGIDLDLRAGEVLGLMGPSLSGKSTLCRVLAGVAPRATGGEMLGTIELGGEAVDIGYVADNPAALMTRTRAIKEVEASIEHLELTRSQSEARALATLAQLGIDEAEAEKYIWELPVQRQLLVALAAAMAEHPKLLILDEVGAVLDANGLALLHQTIRSVTARGGAVLLVDNEAQRQAHWSDRLALMANGQLQAIGPTRDVLGDDAAMAGIGFAPSLSAAAAMDLPDPNEEPILTVSDLEFAHEDDPPVWRGVQLTLRRGEVLGIAGRNAAGKTTLAKLLGGLIQPQAGEIAVEGRRVAAGGDPATIAVVMHSPSAFFSEPSVRGEIAFALRDNSSGPEMINKRVAELADLFGISQLLDHDPSLLPPGSARQVQITAMLAREAPALVLDEAAAGMDPVERARLVAAIREYAARGGSAVVLDHNLDLLGEVAHRIALIENGTLCDAGPPAAAFAEDRWPELAALDLEPPQPASAAIARATET